MEANSDGDVAEQIFNDTVREYVVSFKSSVFLYFVDFVDKRPQRKQRKDKHNCSLSHKNH